MRWLYGLDLGNGLDDIGICSVYQRDTLAITVQLASQNINYATKNTKHNFHAYSYILF